jgi:hypothetical protein
MLEFKLVYEFLLDPKLLGHNMHDINSNLLLMSGLQHINNHYHKKHQNLPCVQHNPLMCMLLHLVHHRMYVINLMQFLHGKHLIYNYEITSLTYM